VAPTGDSRNGVNFSDKIYWKAVIWKTEKLERLCKNGYEENELRMCLGSHRLVTVSNG
jgi:hypothetical protein